MENTHRPFVVEFKETFISSSEAAAILGLRPFGIQKLVKRGRIPAEKIANRWLIRRAFVEEFAKTYVPRRGNPIWRERAKRSEEK